MNRSKRLVVDDDDGLRRAMQLQLEEAGYDVMTASGPLKAIALVEEQTPALVITDLKMPEVSGMDLLKRVRSDTPETTVVMITAFGTVQTAVEAMKSGGYDYIAKPIDYDELVVTVNRAREHQRLVEEVRVLRGALDEKYGFESVTALISAVIFLCTEALNSSGLW
jgi:DNA-binding NtrC family response regulator